MTDRELLELAAKAAGYEVKWSDITECFWIREGSCFDEDSWVPLEDDGDALRLAVKLGLIINIWIEAKKVFAGQEVLAQGVIEPITNDPYAATRRAIVLAAAEIGRTA